ncbi:acc operon protein [Halorientalis salina]|uniref:acc operon protein n=1 Tax=Halorientalis salina TaxID=2932266 RepID=UPI0010ACDB1E|nr:acc operon protein [Halorientalis salina]
MAADTDAEATSDGPTPDQALVAAVFEAVPSATTDQAAAIAAAISAHMNDRQRAAAAAAAESDSEPGWDGKQWAYAGRIQGTLRRDGVRVRRDAPTDEWTAAGRADRM